MSENEKNEIVEIKVEELNEKEKIREETVENSSFLKPPQPKKKKSASFAVDLHSEIISNVELEDQVFECSKQEVERVYEKVFAAENNRLLNDENDDGRIKNNDVNENEINEEKKHDLRSTEQEKKNKNLKEKELKKKEKNDEEEEDEVMNGDNCNFYEEIQDTGTWNVKRRKSLFQLVPREEAESVAMSRRSSICKSKKMCREIVKKFSMQYSRDDEDDDELDDDIKYQVYRKCLTAILYPISKSRPHDLITCHEHKFASCFVCKSFSFSEKFSNFKRCSNCELRVHEKCHYLLNDDCLTNAISTRHSDKASLELMMVMEDQLRDLPHLFNLLRDVFGLDEDTHRMHVQKTKARILQGRAQWKAVLTAEVVSCWGLLGKDSSGKSDPYVTVQVGRDTKRTKTIKQNLNPVWNEKFTFNCTNSTDKMVFQVWDEDFHLASRLKGLFFKDTDEFLGQKVIAINNIAGTSEYCFELDKRSEKSKVEGSLRVKLGTAVSGEKNLSIPYTEQYTLLHMSLIKHLEENDFQFCASFKNNKHKGFFEATPQRLLDEFATRYAISHTFQMMTQIVCLSEFSWSCDVLSHLLCLVDELNQHFLMATCSGKNESTVNDECRNNSTEISNHGYTDGDASHRKLKTSWSYDEKTTSFYDRVVATNFEIEKFIFCLHKLLNSLSLDLTDYKKKYPSNEEQSLKTLQTTVQLIEAVCFFLFKMGRAKADRAKEIISISLTKCVSSTYQMIFYNCREMYCKEFEDKNEDDREECRNSSNICNVESVNDFSEESDDNDSCDDGDINERYEQKENEKSNDKTQSLSKQKEAIKPTLTPIPTLTVASPSNENNDENDDSNTTKEEKSTEEGPNCKDNLNFWSKLVSLMVVVVDEDKSVYSQYINVPNLDIVELNTKLLWKLFLNDIRYILTEGNQYECTEISEYLALRHRVTSFHQQFLLPFNLRSEDFASWFEPYVSKWFEKNTSRSLKLAKNAYEKDKEEKFPKAARYVNFSCIVTDIFTQLTEYYKAVRTIITEDGDTGFNYQVIYAQTVEEVLSYCSGEILKDFEDGVDDDTGITLLNNQHHLKNQLQNLYIFMGEDKCDARVKKAFKRLQSHLSSSLKNSVALFSSRYREAIGDFVQEILKMVSLTPCQPQHSNKNNNKNDNDDQKNDEGISIDKIVDKTKESIKENSKQAFSKVSAMLEKLPTTGILSTISVSGINQLSKNSETPNFSSELICHPFQLYLKNEILRHKSELSSKVYKLLVEEVERMVFEEFESQILPMPISSKLREENNLKTTNQNTANKDAKKFELGGSLSQRQATLLEKILICLKTTLVAEGLKNSCRVYDTMVKVCGYLSFSTTALFSIYLADEGNYVRDPDEDPTCRLKIKCQFKRGRFTDEVVVEVVSATVEDIEKDDTNQLFVQVSFIEPTNIRTVKTKNSHPWNAKFSFPVAPLKDLISNTQVDVVLKSYRVAREDKVVGCGALKVHEADNCLKKLAPLLSSSSSSSSLCDDPLVAPFLDGDVTQNDEEILLYSNPQISKESDVILRVLKLRCDDQLAQKLLKMKTPQYR